MADNEHSGLTEQQVLVKSIKGNEHAAYDVFILLAVRFASKMFAPYA